MTDTVETARAITDFASRDWGMLSTYVAFAEKWHGFQMDKGREPYLWHLLRVGSAMLPHFTAATVGFLHDILEDTPVPRDVVRSMIGQPAYDALLAVTHEKNEPYWDYIDKCAENEIARKVKLADLRDNMNPERLAKVAMVEGEAEAQRLRERYAMAVARLTGSDFRMIF